MTLKKITSGVLTASLILTLATPCFANENVLKQDKLQLISEKETTEICKNTTNVLTTSKMKQNISDAVENGTIEQEYADKLMIIVNKYSETNSRNLNSNVVSPDYYNSKTGASIIYMPNFNPQMQGHGSLTMNKAGYEMVKEIINMGGGAAAIGGGVAALAGFTLAGGMAAILGGILIIESAALAFQFACGNEYAMCAW